MISTKGRYALRVMLDLAAHGGDGAVPLKDVAERQALSKKYLEILVRDLVRGGLLRGTSGKGGGYSLCRPAAEITVGEILALTEGSMAAVACLESGAAVCPHAADCKTLPLWAEYDRLTREFFASKRLSDLL